MLQRNKHTDWKSKLPEYLPDESVWLKVEGELVFGTRLSEQVPLLPLYEPDSEVWDRIAEQLPADKAVAKKFTLRRRIFAVAASIAVLLVLSAMLMFMNTGKLHNENEISFTNLTESDMEQVAIAEIRNYCNLQMSACEQSEFKELMSLYEELQAEALELKNAMNQLGESPEMIQAMIKIENLKSVAIRDLIMLMQS